MFSDIPTVAEIEEEKRKYKIMEGMVYADRCIFLANEKLRHEKRVSSSSDDKTSEEDGSKSGKESNTSVVPPETDITERDMKKPKLSSEAGEDEEAEAQF